jgi:hypothetical protein
MEITTAAERSINRKIQANGRTAGLLATELMAPILYLRSSGAAVV